jgi:hypothetical protein
MGYEKLAGDGIQCQIVPVAYASNDPGLLDEKGASC